MDVRHPYHTAQSFRWVRAEHLLLLALCALLAAHLREVRVLPFVAAFVLIDLIGYVPGAIAFRRAQRDAAGSARVAPLYHHLYNLTHSYVTTAAVLLLWAALRGGPEWAMLAVPIHLSGDRGIFGNTYKPVALPFEPHGDDSRRIEQRDQEAP